MFAKRQIKRGEQLCVSYSAAITAGVGIASKDFEATRYLRTSDRRGRVLLHEVLEGNIKGLRIEEWQICEAIGGTKGVTNR